MRTISYFISLFYSDEQFYQTFEVYCKCHSSIHTIFLSFATSKKDVFHTQNYSLTIRCQRYDFFSRRHVLFKLTALKHNQNYIKHHASAIPPPRQFGPFFDYVGQIFDGLVHTLKPVQIKIPFGFVETRPQIPQKCVGLFYFQKTGFAGTPCCRWTPSPFSSTCLNPCR